MSAGYLIFLFLFILGVVCGSVNEMGLFQQQHMPETQFSITNEQVAQISDDAMNSELNIFVVYTWLVSFVKVIVSGIVATISLSLLFYGMGWPINIVTAACLQMIQLPATLIMFFWVFELITGRSVG